MSNPLDTPVISVVLPVYNGEAFLYDAVKSILDQSYRNFELIIINDGSTDQSEKVILSFSDPRIKYHKNETNLGLIAVLNHGIKLAQGEFIARMDADDLCLPARFEKQLNYLDQHPDVGVVGSWYYGFPSVPLVEVKGSDNNDRLRTILLFAPCFCHPAVMIRKSVLTENDLSYSTEAKHLEDYDLWIRMSKFTKFSNVQAFLFKYRNHSGQISNNFNDIQKTSGNAIRRKYLKVLGFNFSEEELATHNLIANNTFITTVEQLNNIEKWLNALIDQNKKNNTIEPGVFNNFMAKMWFDSCGNSNLGLKAFNHFWRSALSAYYPLTFSDKFKLFVKCVLRSFKKN